MDIRPIRKAIDFYSNLSLSAEEPENERRACLYRGQNFRCSDTRWLSGSLDNVFLVFFFFFLFCQVFPIHMEKFVTLVSIL